MPSDISIPSEWLYRSPSLIIICRMVSGKDPRETLLSSLAIKSKETLLETLFIYIYIYLFKNTYCIYYIYICVCVCMCVSILELWI